MNMSMNTMIFVLRLVRGNLLAMQCVYQIRNLRLKIPVHQYEILCCTLMLMASCRRRQPVISVACQSPTLQHWTIYHQKLMGSSQYDILKLIGKGSNGEV